jgi:hypothetical protein
VTAPPGSRLSRVFGASPALFDAASKLRLGVSVDEARRAAPELFGPAPHRPEGLGDVAMEPMVDAYGRLAGVTVSLPRRSALADVMGTWGEPVKGYDGSSETTLYWWFDPATRMRGTLEEDVRSPEVSRLRLARYFPVAELIGTAPDRFGFEKEPLLGMSEARAMEVYREYMPYLPPAPTGAGSEGLCRTGIVVLPPVEHDDTFTRVRVHCSGQEVRSYEVSVRYALHFALKDQVLRLLRRKLGEPSPKKDVMGREVLEFPASALRVRFREEPAAKDAIIEVARGASSPP